MLYEMGIDRSPEFNPDRYLDWEVQNGYVASLNDINQLAWDGPVAYAAQRGKEIIYYGQNWDKDDNQIWFNINAGYWTIVDVGNHYVLVDNAASSARGEIYFYESAYNYTWPDSRPLSVYGYRARIFVYKYTSSTAALDVNGYLDGNVSGNLQDYGTFDMYVNNSCVSYGANDYFDSSAKIGSSYEVRNIRANTGYKYNGVYSGTLYGSLPSSGMTIVLSFSKVPPTAISMRKSLELQVGETSTLAVNYQPSEVHKDYKDLSWKSSDTSVATVDQQGVVRAVGEGTAVITSSSVYNPNISCTCSVTVKGAIAAPQIVLLTVNGKSVHAEWTESPLRDANDIRGYEVFVYPKGNVKDCLLSDRNVSTQNYDITMAEHGQYVFYVRAVNKADESCSSFSAGEFTILDSDWLYCDEKPENLSGGEVQYLNHYEDKVQEQSPGDDWKRGKGQTSYVKGDVLYSTVPQAESDALVYIGTYYYHFCDGSGEVERFRTERFCHETILDNDGQFDIVGEYTDSDPNYKVYRLRWNSGQWAGGLATCSYGSSDAMALYYVGYRYQRQTAVTTYTWSKEDTWDTEPDTAADSVSCRVREVPCDHKMEKVGRVDPTCGENGTETYWKCSACERLFSDVEGRNQIAKPPIIKTEGHKPEKVDRVEPTCTANGSEAYWKCAACEKLFSDAEGKNQIANPPIIKTEGHKLEKVDRVEPTCIANGVEAYWKCAVCEKLFSDAEGKTEIEEPVVLGKSDHIIVIDKAKEPTVEEAGWTEGSHCAVCGKVFAEQHAVPKLMPGDINGDNKVDGRDVLRLMKYLAAEDNEKTGELIEINYDNADVDGNGNINEKDLLRLIRYLGGENVKLLPGAMSGNG